MRFEDYLAEKMNDPDFKAGYDALTPEYDAFKAKIEKDIRRSAARDKSVNSEKLTVSSKLSSFNYQQSVTLLSPHFISP